MSFVIFCCFVLLDNVLKSHVDEYFTYIHQDLMKVVFTLYLNKQKYMLQIIN